MALSLRTASIVIIIIGLIFTSYSLMLSEVANNYNVNIDEGTQKSFNVINQSVEEEYTRIQNQSDKIYEITGSEILEGAFEGGSAIIQIFKAPFKTIELSYKIINEFSSILGIPIIIIRFFEAIILITIMWLIIYSIRRYREDR